MEQEPDLPKSRKSRLLKIRFAQNPKDFRISWSLISMMNLYLRYFLGYKMNLGNSIAILIFRNI